MIDIYIENAPTEKSQSKIGEQMIRYYAAEQLAITPDAVFIHREPCGKPIIDGVHFNISHSGTLVVCVLSSSPVGVDIEQIKHANLRISKRFFHSREIKYLQNAPKPIQNNLFYQLWTMKEAYLKRMGAGIGYGLSRFNVLEEPKDHFYTAIINHEYALSIHSAEPIQIGSYPKNITWSVTSIWEKYSS